MSSAIATNLNSMGAQRHAGRSQNELSTAIARLSSGLRINTARDDAAGLAISDRFTAQIRGTHQAARNANDAISLSQTAESALGSVSDALQRIRELAVQSANATNSASDRAALQQEVAQLVQEIDRVATQTQFNGVSLLDGSFTAKAFQVGADRSQTITVGAIAGTRTSALGVYQGIYYENAGSDFPNNNPGVFTLTIGSGPTINLGTIPVDAKLQANAINSAQIPGLTARAYDTLLAAGVSTATGSGSGTAVFTLNGVAINLAGVSGGAALSGNRASAVAAINGSSSVTGVFAVDTGAGVSLQAPDGRSIVTAYSAGSFTGSNAADFGLSLNGGQVRVGQAAVSYVAPAGVTGNVVWNISGLPLVYAIGPTGTALSAIDVSTLNGANAAIRSADSALNQVNATRATLGAVQNRFAAAIENLQSRGENLSAARSRIQDADFAMETANLSRAQVLQEAGTAMIAQANQLPQQVLALLR